MSGRGWLTANLFMLGTWSAWAAYDLISHNSAWFFLDVFFIWLSARSAAEFIFAPSHPNDRSAA